MVHMFSGDDDEAFRVASRKLLEFAREKAVAIGVDAPHLDGHAASFATQAIMVSNEDPKIQADLLYGIAKGVGALIGQSPSPQETWLLFQMAAMSGIQETMEIMKPQGSA